MSCIKLSYVFRPLIQNYISKLGYTNPEVCNLLLKYEPQDLPALCKTLQLSSTCFFHEVSMLVCQVQKLVVR